MAIAAYLAVATLHHLWQEWEFGEAMVLNRCLEPLPKIQIKERMATMVLPAYLDINPHKVDEFEVYCSLDYLSKREAELQSFLYQRLQVERPSFSDYFFYDLTSTYVEGSS